MKNRELANIFNKIGDALEFKNELSFKVSAYRKAAKVLEDLPEDIEKIWQEGKLRTIPGIGEGIAKKIDEYLRTGSMKKYEEAIKDIPEGLFPLFDVQGLGPKTIKLAYEKLGVKSKEDLMRVIEDGSLAQLYGMGIKKVENIKKGLETFEAAEKRIPIGVALPLVEEIIDWIKKLGVKNISPAGSLRRMKETIGDIDILVSADNGEKIIDHFTKFYNTERILAKGDTKGSIITKEGYQIDLRVVPDDCYGAALQYFTGSKAHNIKLRTIAKAKGLKISEYGVFRGEKKIAGKDEKEIYEILGLPFIPPELREDRGECELKEIPPLIDYNEIKGDLHIHSKYSDGGNSIKEIAEYAKKLGYKYIAITDHSKSARYAHGVDEDHLKKELKEIENVEKEVGIRIFKGIEVEIKKDGSLDFSTDILKKLDIVIAGLHIFPKEDMTDALISVCKNPNVDIIAHPSGRLISRREGYKVDLEKVMRAAKETSTLLEINCYYDRLDLSDINAKMAKDYGIKMVLGSDAHSIGMMYNIRYGIGTARRGWLSPQDVINTYDDPTQFMKDKRLWK